MIETFRVGLLLTERCNASCAHCWLTPEHRTDMGEDEARGFIDQASEIPTVEWVSFTGGEPFLLPDLLERLVGYASEKRLRTECVTNCHWADTPEIAEGQLERLVEAGLDAVNISADDFHQRHIPFESVGNAFEAARRLGLKTVIQCASSKRGTLRIGEIVERLGGDRIHILGSPPPPGEVSALAVETGFIPVGRAANLPVEDWVIGESPMEGPCRLVLWDIGVSPSGWVLPCCSAASTIAEMRLGDARNEKIAKIVEEAGGRPLFRALAGEGPSGLAERLGLRSETGYVSRCHLCYEVLTHPDLNEALLSF
ncbi:MAG: radical SAM protein [Candidatus Bathyarchaeota archaeon]|nr:MAG: radical SAM protein [Candidatus Bathyarchaeota archaeon]